MPKIKPQIDISPSVYGKFAMMANEHKAVNFTQGAPDFDTPEWLIDRTNFHMKNAKNQYSPIPGTPALRKAMIKKTKQCYGVSIELDNPKSTTLFELV